MFRTLTAVTTAAVFSVGLATAVSAAQLKGGGPPVGGPFRWVAALP